MRTSNTDKLRQEVKHHIDTDAITQRNYWDGSRGCFIGCLSHSNNPLPLAQLYGLPLTLVRLAESVFERLPAGDAKQFFADFPEAVATDGKNLTLVVWKFLASELRSLPPTDLATQAAIDLVIAGMDLLAAGQGWPAAAKVAANNAAAAAEAAAEAAADAAVAAEWAAIKCATAAFSSAECATADFSSIEWAAAAELAALSAEWAAIAAAKTAVGDWFAGVARQRDLLLRLIREAPVAQP